jgi:hypothetical protein
LKICEKNITNRSDIQKIEMYWINKTALKNIFKSTLTIEKKFE